MSLEMTTRRLTADSEWAASQPLERVCAAVRRSAGARILETVEAALRAPWGRDRVRAAEALRGEDLASRMFAVMSLAERAGSDILVVRRAARLAPRLCPRAAARACPAAWSLSSLPLDDLKAFWARAGRFAHEAPTELRRGLVELAYKRRIRRLRALVAAGVQPLSPDEWLVAAAVKSSS